MDKTPRYPLQTDAGSASSHPCPTCGGKIHRMRRRPIDRVTSLWAEKRRYRCANFSCRWEGNLALDRNAALRHGRRQRLPLTFVISMSMVAASMVAALGFATIELLPGLGKGVAGLMVGGTSGRP